MKKEIITKKYNLINAKYSLTALESKIALTVIAMVRKEDEAFFEYQIPIKHFETLVKDRNYGLLKKTCLSLMRKPLTIEDGKDFLIFNWFSSIKYVGKDGLIYFKISDELKPYLLALKDNFKSYDLKYIMPLRSDYSIRVYELLKQYEKIGYRVFQLDEFINVLDIPKSYKYADIKRRILIPAELEINEHTDIYIKFEEIKPSRAVTGIRFGIVENFFTSDNTKFYKWIDLMRTTYINKELIYYPELKANVRINTKGYLYLDNGLKVTADKAKTFWRWAYENKDKLLVPALKL